jgi:predicted RNase H-like nuclease (RuvC/YqgF family)
MENIYTVLMTAITVIGGSAAWRYYEKRAQKKEEDDRWIKNDCTSRITKLEALLEQSSKEKDEMRQTILTLTAQVAELRTKVDFLQNNKYEN